MPLVPRRNSQINMLAAALILLAAGSSSVGAADRVFIAIGTGGPTGVYFVAGNSICRMVHREAAKWRQQKQHGLRCAAPSTGGSADNIENIRDGELDFGVVQSDLQFHAYNGTSRFVENRFDKLRAVFSVHPEPFHILVGKGSGINSWADLKGKRVNIGNPGSGQRGTMEILMAAYGTTIGDFKAIAELTSTEQSKALCDDRIDAYGYTVGIPDAGVAVATDGCGARVLSLNSSVEQKLVAENPFYEFATIPRGTYRTSASEVTTFGVMATLVTSADQPDEVVYELVRSVFENLDDFRDLHPAFAQLDPGRMIGDGLSAPLHPGAEKYYRENGWM